MATKRETIIAAIRTAMAECIQINNDLGLCDTPLELGIALPGADTNIASDNMRHFALLMTEKYFLRSMTSSFT
mgnify:CR=1 FL=1